MIATLTGTVAEKIGERVILDVQGVGYGLLVTPEDYGLLTTGNTVKVYVYEHIRENSYDLYGFVNLDTQKLFEQLLEVSGVGPKMALNVLGTGSANEVRKAIAQGDLKFIQQANGVGKRVAERVIVELKDKVGYAAVGLADTGLLQSDMHLQQDEAVEALVALGYTPQDAALALANVSQALSTEERIKEALRK